MLTFMILGTLTMLALTIDLNYHDRFTGLNDIFDEEETDGEKFSE